ncbi:hypothetical protein HC891_19905 [Candidatus Gracilibacteria bacterium]|nr:hypothetical protein [Candidatus Gracilibacteria bacterium]
MNVHVATLAPHGAPTTGFYIETLHELRVMRDGDHLAWPKVGVGIPTLRRMFSYLLAHPDELISMRVLLEIAGSRAERSGFPVSGLLSMLRKWGLHPAIERKGHGMACRLRLRRNALWRSDTDAIDLALAQLNVARSAGDAAAELAALRSGAIHCKGHFLPDYDGPPDYPIDAQRDHWADKQKVMLRSLARYCAHSTDSALYPEGYAAIQRALYLDHESVQSNELAQLLAELLDDRRAAKRYQQRVLSLRQRN